MAIIFFLISLFLAAALLAVTYHAFTVKAELVICKERFQAAATAHETQTKRMKAAFDKLREQNHAVKEKYKQRKAMWQQMDLRFRKELKLLSQYKGIADADSVAAEKHQALARQVAESKATASKILSDASQAGKTEISNAKRDAAEIQEAADKILSDASQAGKIEFSNAKRRAAELQEAAETALNAATLEASEMIRIAETQAKEIAGSAFDAKNNAALYEKAVRAMKNRLKGYGDEYIVPEHSLLDDLADDFDFADAGRQLKVARDRTRLMIRNGTAADCDYVEATRKNTAINFVLDAFNGKVDSILGRTKHDNAGKLQQAIRDAFNLVNYNGQAFRSARIRNEYLDARLEELRWGEVSQQLKQQEREEQRAAKQKIREEAKAAREQARALKEAAKEEEQLQKALLQVREQFADASEEQREMYEQRLKDMEVRLQQANERKERARSMAEQTKKGYVYIISNVGSFGENVFKIGLTRRDDPMDRVKELGDSSVPFGFDVHAMILSDDAPALENRLHKHFILNQINKVNHRKEFFKVAIKEIRDEIDSLQLTTGVKWTMTADAMEHRESLAIESAINDDPKAKEQWMNRQLRLES